MGRDDRAAKPDTFSMTDSVLVTGISGFIAKHVALSLLRAGFAVRGTVRALTTGEKVRATLVRHGADATCLEFVAADLTADAGWTEAVAGCRYVAHVASPFPMSQPLDREGLVPAARDGALRVISAALKAGAERVVMTSSMAAMAYRANRPATITFGEQDWTDPDWPVLSAYVVSKTRAELAAWDYVRQAGAEARFATVNPGFVLGPALDSDIGTSLRVIQMIMKGTYPALPPTSFPIIDARDLGELHVAALTKPAAASRRLIGAADTLSMQQMGRELAKAFPAYAHKIPTHRVPAGLVRLAALFNPGLSAILPDLGTVPLADSRYVSELTGVTFRPAAEAVRAAGASLIEHKLV